MKARVRGDAELDRVGLEEWQAEASPPDVWDAPSANHPKLPEQLMIRKHPIGEFRQDPDRLP